MTLGDDRWIEITPSQFPHETEGLKLVRKLLPDESPYRAWSNFEFRDNHGRWHEVDLLVLGRRRLHLVELKYYSGTLRGNDHTWLRDGKRAEASPLKLARRKAQYLSSLLKDELLTWARETGTRIPDLRDGVPFVQEAVFLHHPHLRCELGRAESLRLYGLDRHETQTHLPGISRLLLERPDQHHVVTATHERIVPILMKRLGLVPRREREVGSWIVQESMLSQGDGWQEWRANHAVNQTQQARIRFRVPPPGATTATLRELAKLSEHEYRTMTRIVHDGLLRPVDLVADDGLGTGLVYPYDESLQRLDHWLAAQEQGVPLATQLLLIRQVAEAVHYAHGSSVAHRALSPEAVWVRTFGDGSVKALVGDWHAVGSAAERAGTGLPSQGVTVLHRAGDDSGDDDAPGFRAPEDTWAAVAADRFRLDVFGVGALAAYLLTGRAPATSAAALHDRLRQQGGLDISPELPEASEALRELVLAATRPVPSERTPDLATFLQQLSDAERAPSPTVAEPDVDPLDATPGTLLADRFRLERRLGQGSTAVGLLVTDLAHEGSPQRVLKVALDDAAAGRLHDEADVLRGLDSPRLVKLLDGPLTVGGRTALLLEPAGTETLAEAMRERDRLSLDLLQRYGTDLLEALVALDAAGVDHRDIKPANLGIRTSRGGDRAKHLVLFDFSLTRAAASATEAGTPPYLDPFLTGERDRYDSAAERYAVAVVLFEMATGRTPVYGDPEAHPASVEDDVTVERAAFDRSVARRLEKFFASALSRDVGRRQHTAAQMLQEWEAAFPDSATTVPDDADELAAAVTMATPLTRSGLSARALSAIEPLGVRTVGDVVTLDQVALNAFRGAADTTRREVKSRTREWRRRFADEISTRQPATTTTTGLPTPQDAADLLLAHVGAGRSESKRAMVRLILGLGSEVDAFATHAQLGASMPTPMTGAGATQVLGRLQAGWAGTIRTRELLGVLDFLVRERVEELGGVATVDELTETVLGAMTARGTAGAPQAGETRLAQGLLRAVHDRQRALMKADAEGVEPLHTRRRDGHVILFATQPAWLEVAEQLGLEADRLVSTDSGGTADALVPASTVADRLTPLVAASGAGTDTDNAAPAALQDPLRLARLAAGVSRRAAASGIGELHHRDLAPATAVARTLRGVAAHRGLSPHAVQDRVRHRFPALPPLPPRPQLDHVVASADVGLVYDGDAQAYRPVTAGGDTTGLQTHAETRVVEDLAPISSAGVAGQRLLDSRRSRSFLALGVPGHRLERATRVLTRDFGTRELNLTEVLLRALREQSDAAGMSWATVRAADAAAAGTRPAQGLAALVSRAIPTVEAAIEQALADGDGTDSPVLLTDAAPLARYGHLSILAPWTELARPRPQALWLVVPQLRGNRGALLDGRPVQLNSFGQFITLDSEWLASRDEQHTSRHDAGVTA